MFFVLLIVRETSAICCAERWLVPLKMTFSIFSERNALVFCSPNTQRIESTTLDFPQPLGPTMPVIPSSKLMTILSAKLLNPLISSFDSCISRFYQCFQFQVSSLLLSVLLTGNLQLATRNFFKDGKDNFRFGI